MHLYLIARGSKDRLDRWVNDCLARYYPFKCGENNKKPIIGRLQLSMRPIQLYEAVFPEEHLDAVVGALQPYGGYGFATGVKKHMIKLLRKLLKLEPIPQGLKVDADKFNNVLYGEFVDVMGVGIKRDKDYHTKIEDL